MSRIAHTIYQSTHIYVCQSQPISAVLPDVKQVQVQRPHQHPAQAPKRQSINLLDLAFGPSSPERPPAPAHAQAASGGFDADPFASQPSGGLGASASAASQGAWLWVVRRVDVVAAARSWWRPYQ